MPDPDKPKTPRRVSVDFTASAEFKAWLKAAADKRHTTVSALIGDMALVWAVGNGEEEPPAR